MTCFMLSLLVLSLGAWFLPFYTCYTTMKARAETTRGQKLLVFLPLELIPKCTLGSRGFFSCAAGCFVPGAKLPAAKALVTVKTVTGLTQTIGRSRAGFPETDGQYLGC